MWSVQSVCQILLFHVITDIWILFIIAVILCCCCCKHFLEKFLHLGWMMILVDDYGEQRGNHEPHSCTVWSHVSSALSVTFLFPFAHFMPSDPSLHYYAECYTCVIMHLFPSWRKQSSDCLLLHPVIRERIITTLRM